MKTTSEFRTCWRDSRIERRAIPAGSQTSDHEPSTPAPANGEVGSWIGPTWVSTLDQRVQADDEGLVYATADGARLSFPPSEPGHERTGPAGDPRLPTRVGLGRRRGRRDPHNRPRHRPDLRLPRAGCASHQPYGRRCTDSRAPSQGC
ncbi:DUF6531 domain-containing protein [Streptomyces caelestis]|uniref:DUF6531 domain-containing protein n=1 Tax=Streptomyces caelestis TaxID=36816 RepID=UPI00370140A3